MTDNEMIIALGYLDCKSGELPDYLNSHDAIQEIIDCMVPHRVVKYHAELFMMFDFFDKNVHAMMLQATARQKCEAALKAFGKWVD